MAPATRQVASRGWRGAEMEGSGGADDWGSMEIEEWVGRRPKMAGEASIYRMGARVRGFSLFRSRSIAIGRSGVEGG